MKMKKVTSFVLTCAMALSMVSVTAISGFADAENVCTYNTTINSFNGDTELTTVQYGVLRDGNISAQKINGKWYYVFDKDGYVVNVKATAFKGKKGNTKTLEAANQMLTDSIMNDSGIGSSDQFVFKKKLKTTTREVPFTPVKSSNLQKNTMTTYKTLLWKADLYGYRSGISTELDCTECGNIQFIFNDRVDSITKEGTGYHKLKTAEDYMLALQRMQDASTSITPTITLDVEKPGASKVCLANMEYHGRGIADTNVDITSLIKVLYTATKTVTSPPSAGTLHSLNSLVGQTIKLIPTSNEYVNNKTIPLSDFAKKRTIYTAQAEAPIKLANVGDYFKVSINLNESPTLSGGDQTQLRASITF